MSTILSLGSALLAVVAFKDASKIKSWDAWNDHRGVQAWQEKPCVTWQRLNSVGPDLERVGTLKTRTASEIKSSKWSVGCETLDRDYADWDQYKRFLGDLGAKRARFFSGWAKTEQEKGVYDFAWLDRQVRECAAMGVKPWVCLSYGNPVWGSDFRLGMRVKQVTDSPEAFAAWLRYVRALVRKIGDVVDEWEIWNEPFGQAEEYAQLVYETAKAVKEIQSQATCIVTAINFGSDRDPSKNEYRTVAEKLKKENALALVKYWVFHPYCANPDWAYLTYAESEAIAENNVDTYAYRRYFAPEFAKFLKGYSKDWQVLQGEVGCPSQLEFAHALSGIEWTEYAQAKWNLRLQLGAAAREIPSNLFTFIDLQYTFMLQSFGQIRSNTLKEPVYRRPSYRGMKNFYSIFDDDTKSVRVEKRKVAGRELSVARFVRGGQPFAAVWFSGARPGDSLDYEKLNLADLGLAAGSDWVDLLTGRIYRLSDPSAVPVWDSPVLLTPPGLFPHDRPPNILPVSFESDNVGGFLGWEMGGAKVAVLPERGPDGGKILRFTDSGGAFTFAHAKRKLAAGGNYRLSANVRVHNLNGPRRFELMLHPWPWSCELKAPLPRETHGKWQPVVWEGALPPSEKDAYDCVVYCSDPLAGDATFDLADLRLEAIDGKAETGASPIPEAKPYVARICPIDPCLAEVDPRQAKIRFYYGGPIADTQGQPYQLRATLGEIARDVPWDRDHLATVDFGSVKPGRLPLHVEVLPADATERVTPLAKNDYTAIVRPIIDNPTPLKRLNNLASEIFSRPLANGEFPFVLAKAGWVYVGTDRPYETVVADLDESFPNVVRYRPREPNGSACFLEAGRHVVRVRGVPGGTAGTLVARLVKPVTVGGFANALAGKYMTCRRTEEYFEHCGLFGTINFTNTRIGMPESVRAKFADRGVQILGDVSCAAHLSVRENPSALWRLLTQNAYFTNGIPFTLDENGVNIDTRKKYTATEAMWRLCESGLRVDAFLEDGYRARFNRPGLDYPDLSAYLNLGEGRSFACSECYWRSPVDAEEMAATVAFMRRQIRELRALVPSAPSRLLYYLNGFMTVGDWTSWIYPHVDMKAFDAKILHILATDPEFADIGGVGSAGMYCDEDYLRSMYAAFRHYVIEGRTDDFCERQGLAVFPGHLRNGDFDEDFAGWTVENAAKDSLTVVCRKGMGTRDQQRRCWWFEKGTYAVGEHAAAFTPSEKGVNRLSQTLTGLTAGALYQVVYVTMGGGDPVSGRIEGAEEIPELRQASPRPLAPKKAKLVQTRIVFRAKGTTARLVLSDPPRTARGETKLVNYVGCRRYFVRDETELEDLKELLGVK